MLGWLVFILLLVAAAYAIKRLRRRRQSNATGPTPPPIFRIVSLGLPGSGKTVLLASIFNEFYAPRPYRSYHLETDARSAGLLHDVHRVVVNSDLDWPPATALGGTREYLFTFIVRDGDARSRVMQMSYLDYPGELHEDTQEIKLNEIESLDWRVRHANAIFGILDGKRIAQYLRGEAAGYRYVRADLASVLSSMTKATCPIHFILTKWDLVHDATEVNSEDPNSTLRAVKEALLSDPAFAGLVDAAVGPGRIVRIIPVSSIGPEFAKLRDGERVEKVAGARVEPFNVDVPMSVVIPDYFTQIANDLGDRDLDAIRRSYSVGKGSAAEAAGRTLQVVGGAAQAAIGTALRFSAGAATADAVTGLFFDWVSRPVRERAAEYEQSQIEAEALEQDERRAQSQLLHDFQKVLWRLEDRFPSSRLTDRA